MRCAIYARYSSDLQDERSIADQIDLCRERAQREGWRIVAEFHDAAISGASIINRPQMLNLLAAAKDGQFDIVLTESMDRISRDQEDSAGIYKRLGHWNVSLVTLTDGKVGKLHVGMRSLFASMFLDDLAQKTRRGLVGRHKAGRSTGGRTYGYRPDPHEPGALIIEPAEALIVNRIFREYVDGRSPRAIVTDLNREGIPSPRGGQWNASTLNGSRARANGILCNRLYIGECLYGRQRNVKDPETGRQQKRLVPKAEWLVRETPELAIIDRATFDVAQAHRATSSQKRLTHRRRPRHVLSGLVFCGHCHGTMAIARYDALACSTRTNKGTCDNRRTIKVGEVEQRVLVALQKRLLSPEAVAVAVEAYRVRRSETAAQRRNAARQHAIDLRDVERKISKIVAAIEDDEGEVTPLVRRLKELEADREAIVAAAPVAMPDDVLELHPRASAAYRAKVEGIQAALAKGDAAGSAAVEAVRRLIQRIVFNPQASGPAELVIEGDLAVMLESERATNKGAVSMVPPSRIERETSRSTI